MRIRERKAIMRSLIYGCCVSVLFPLICPAFFVAQRSLIRSTAIRVRLDQLVHQPVELIKVNLWLLFHLRLTFK